MANTKIPVELSSTPGIVDNSNATAITISADENLGVGTTTITNNTLGTASYFGNSTTSIVGDNTSGNSRFWLSNNWYYNSGDKYIITDEASMYTQQNGTHQFLTAPSGSADSAISFSNKLTIDADGLKFNGDTAATNALDDYEEGTFTPTISAGGVTYDYQVGWYTKIGNLVNVGIHLDVSVNSNASGTAVAITLPFTSSYSNAQAYSMTSAIWCNGWASTPKADIGLLGHGASAVTFYYNNGTTLGASTQGQLGGGNMLFNIQYTAA